MTPKMLIWEQKLMKQSPICDNSSQSVKNVSKDAHLGAKTKNMNKQKEQY